MILYNRGTRIAHFVSGKLVGVGEVWWGWGGFG